MELLQEINALARTAKIRELTPKELARRDELRQAFLAQFRANMQGGLDALTVARPDGTSFKLGDVRRREAADAGRSTGSDGASASAAGENTAVGSLASATGKTAAPVGASSVRPPTPEQPTATVGKSSPAAARPSSSAVPDQGGDAS